MWLQYIPGFLFLAAIVGFFPFLRFLEYQVRRDRRKRLAELAALPCPRCGVPFGAEAADAARKEGERQMAEASLLTELATCGVAEAIKISLLRSY